MKAVETGTRTQSCTANVQKLIVVGAIDEARPAVSRGI
jgi:hypothetical protein